jgi:EpsI family protein
LIVVGLVAVTAVLVSVPHRDARADIGAPLDVIPLALGDWRGRMANDADQVLPVDDRSIEWTRRVYERGERRVWLGVARYMDVNGPDTRPALHAITPATGTMSVTRSTVHLTLSDATTLAAMRISRHHPSGTLTTWYWYRLGDRLIGNEYSLRFWLGVDTLLRRRRPLWLVRVSTTDGHDPDDFVRLLAPRLNTLSPLTTRTDS